MRSISPSELSEKLRNDHSFQLIDVREEFERERFNIGGDSIPLNTLLENPDRIPKNREVVLYCQKGIRSALAIQRLEQRHGFTNLINLSGGLDAWKVYLIDNGQ